MNQKDIRMVKMLDKGMSPARVAEKCGYNKSNIQQGIERVADAARRCGRVDIIERHFHSETS